MIGGISIITILGIVNFFLLLFQLLSGTRVVKVRMTLHRKVGKTLFVVGAVHGLLALLA